jgi:hypothetical protein
MTDYKQLCVELVRVADALDGRTPLTSNQGQALDGYSALAQFRYVADRARTALAEPEPEGPTRRQLMMLADDMGMASVGDAAEYGRAVLARWGNHPASPDSSLQPISVTERLPGPEDCDREGNVWAWRRFDPENGIDNGDFWCLASCEWLGDEDSGFTHWLPAHALPVPS